MYRSMAVSSSSVSHREFRHAHRQRQRVLWQLGPDDGGILNQGTLTVRNSTLAGNRGFFESGGISNSNTLTVEKSTFWGNEGTSVGGIFNSGTLRIRTSTRDAKHRPEWCSWRHLTPCGAISEQTADWSPFTSAWPFWRV
jgi:hypothetical protein